MWRGIYKTTPTAMVDSQQREMRLSQFGALITSNERPDGTMTAAGTANDPTNVQTAYLPAGTDRSGVTSATAGTATTLAPANATRRVLNVQNISAGTIGINEIGGTAAIGTAGTYTVPAGGSINVRTNRAISVVGSAASLSYSATES